MDLNVQYTTRRRFHVRDDHFDEGEVVKYRSPVSDRIQRNPTATFLIKGKVRIENPNRDPIEYEAGLKRLANGAIFPGEYKATFLEPSIFRCLHISYRKDISMYEVKDIPLNAGQSFTADPESGIEVIAIMDGKIRDEKNKEYEGGSLIEVVDRPVTVVAIDQVLLSVGVKKDGVS